jgi:Zn finger protein HypA/HybF involved in hydrogenase expression
MNELRIKLINQINSYSKQKYFESHLIQEEKDEINHYFGDTIGQKIYNYYHNITSQPLCICGKPLKFKSFSVGYLQYCSTSCKSKHQIRNPEASKKAYETYKQIMRSKYGVDNYWQTEESKNLKRDFSNRLKRSPEAEKIALIKRETTNLQKYGNKCALHGVNHDKTQQILDKKYGINGVQKLANKTAMENRHLKFRETIRKWCELNQIEILSLNFRQSKNVFKCKKCGQKFHRINGYPQCPKCNKHNQFISKKEKEIVKYIRFIYTGPVWENDRHTLNGKELDIYLPDLKLAIEYNGTYWHGYHKGTDQSLYEFKKKIESKRLECQSLGIRLITIDECDYLDRPEVFKRFLNDQLLPRRRVYARNCEIKEIDTNTAKNFCKYYHVNGFRGGKYKYGLYHNDELLIVAIFGKHKSEYECVRLCYKTGYDIIGGWAKIQKHFGKRFLHYINLKYFQGENKTGFGFRFLINGIILHRNALQKKTGLYKHCTKIDTNLSDFQNCLMNNGIAIFDLGNDIRWYN